ncbi:MAG: hypothetical protein QM813_00765 [Verrucomicrobiota bacterium]
MGTAALFEQLIDPLAECLTVESAQRVVDLVASPAVTEGIANLAERANDGLLSESERAEFEAILSAADFIAIIQLKARHRLAVSNS